MILVGAFISIGLILNVTPAMRIFSAYSTKILTHLGYGIVNERPNMCLEEISVQPISPLKKDIIYEKIIKGPQDLHRGELLLINSDNAYTFTMEDELIPLALRKNKTYKIMDANMQLSGKMLIALNRMMADFEKDTGKHDMIVTSAYRSLEEQKQIFKEKANEFGEEEALKWAMFPGYSEHHMGYAVDLSICTDDHIYVPYKGQNEYAWINQNAFKYGIIRRYTEEKTGITGISNEPWHYRYVGIPHAYLMTIHGFCLEEYLSYIRQFTFKEEHLMMTTDQGTYEIYYVPAKQYETKIPVPQGKTYTISGDNVEGFIVTLYLEQA